MTSIRRGLVAGLLALSAFGLSACADDEPTNTPTDTESPTDVESPGDADELSEQAARDRIAHFLGVSEERALELASDMGWTLRVARRGDETFALTEDYMIGRVTVELDSEDDGQTWRVTSATVEATDGPVTEELQPS